MRSLIRGVVLLAYGPADRRAGDALLAMTLMRRRRKHRVSEFAATIPATYRAFDLLYVDGESYLCRSYPDRRARLEAVLPGDGEISSAGRIVTGDIDGITGTGFSDADLADLPRRLALRFPRFVRWRDEKSPGLATTAAEVAAIFRRRGV